MRALAAFLVLTSTALAAGPSPVMAQTQDCTGENCPPQIEQGAPQSDPAGPPRQEQGGHDCERKEPSIS